MKRISKILAAWILVSSMLVAAVSPVLSETTGAEPPSAPTVNAAVNTPAPSPLQTEKTRIPVTDWRTAPVQTGPSVWGMLQGLGLCLAVFFLGIWLLKKTKGIAPVKGRRNFKIIERFPISPRSALLLVEIRGREVVLSVGSDNVSVIDDGLNAFLSADGSTEEEQEHETGEKK